MGGKSKFLSLVSKEGGLVTLRDSNTVRIIGKGTIGNDRFAISNVRLVDGLKYNITSLLHLDLFGPERYVSLGGKNYAFVIVDDYSHFTWVLFLRTKDEAFVEFKDLINSLETKYSYKLKTIRSDQGASDESSGSPKTPDSVSNVIFVTPLDNSSQAEMRLSHSNETTPIQFQADNSNEEEMSNIHLPKSSRTVKNHPPDNLLTKLDQGISTRSRLHNMYDLCAFVAEFEPKNAQEAVTDEHWSVAIQEELNQFERCDIWKLVPPPQDAKIIGTRWVFKNKNDEDGNIIHNKARLVAQGYNHQE
ncbi:uncharacterized protein LOC141724260 [Apium graveolens]|uniref:uncharacterized protein LOC141724260 n=1 Tax=Apium graveolens TaxID=4045 RepID=UPI003D7B6EF1